MIHDKIREARVQRGISQAKLARVAEVPRSQLAIFEAGGNITISTLQKLIAQLPGLRMDVIPSDLDVDEARRIATEMQQLAAHMHAVAGTLLQVLAGAVPPSKPSTAPLPGGGGATRFDEPPPDPALIKYLDGEVEKIRKGHREPKH